MQTILKHKGILLGVVAVIIIFVGYLAYKGSSPQTASSGGVTRTAVSTVPSSAGVAPGPGQEFVSQLLAIHNINLNLDLFSDPVFLGLHDFSRTIPDQPKSRLNPFAPINPADLTGAVSAATPDSSVTMTGATDVSATPQAGVTTKKTTATTGTTGTTGGIFQAVPTGTTAQRPRPATTTGTRLPPRPQTAQ